MAEKAVRPMAEDSRSISTERPLVTFLLRSLFLGIGGMVTAVLGIAIAMWQPAWIWQPSSPNFGFKKQQFTLTADALFDQGKAVIRPESAKLLDEIAAQLPMSAGKSVRIMGHLDAGNNENGALALSYLRAAAVESYLMRLRGEQTYHWIAIGFGSSRPLTPNDSNNSRKTNRRIEIVVDD
ncbi:OmpA family protein [Tumidithrix helvetica PCC 7403]|uniref:OmpA family protein n=1 Tax=Tumidithrix helvetica TaxID=3457545 RepID=UPI003C8C9AAC